MKTKHLILSLITSLFVATIPLKAQKNEQINYYKNHPELGGDVIITKLVNEIIGDESYTTFEITSEAAGAYYMNLWLLPAQYADDSFSTFEVLVNGNNVGRIVATKSNWQSIGLPDNGMVDLQEGDNTISVVANVPEVAEIEFVRLSKAVDKAVIISETYDSYLSKAKNGKTDENISQIEEAGQTDLESIAPRFSGPAWMFQSVPVKYSVHKSHYFSKGQEIIIISQSNTPHVLDFYINDGYIADTQYLSWMNISELSFNSPFTQLAKIIVTIPVSAYYTVKARSYENGVSGTVNMNVNGEYYYPNSPVYYAGRNVMQGEDRDKYEAYVKANGADPILYVEGCGSNPGRIVAFNDDAPNDKRIEHNLGNTDSYIAKSYFMPTTAVHVSNYSSNNPESICTIFANEFVFDVPPSYGPGKSTGTDDTDGTTGIAQASRMETSVYPNPVDISSVLNIHSADELNAVEVYDISGRLIQSRSVSGASVQIPMSELSIDKTGIYLFKLIGMSGSTTERLLVR